MIPVSQVAVKVYSALFNNGPMPEGFKARAFKGGALKGAEGKGLTMVEQNPKTQSAYAKMAQQGKKILWTMKGPHYIGAVIDGSPEPRLEKAMV